MKDEIRSCIIAFCMYTRLPLPVFTWEEDFCRAICYFPMIGILLGALELLWGILSMPFHPLFRAAVFVCINFLICGGIHFDGFLDTCDALGSWKEKEERLRILKDPHTGAAAITGAGIYFLLLTSAAGQLIADQAYIFAIPAFLWSRIGSMLLVTSLPFANPAGLAARFGKRVSKRDRNIACGSYALFYFCYIICICFKVGYLTALIYGMLPILITIIFYLYWKHKILNIFGGVTGDLAGYFSTMAELLIILAVALVSTLIGKEFGL